MSSNNCLFTFSSSWLWESASNSSGAAHASVPKCCDTYSASINAAAPMSATFAVSPLAVNSTLLDLRSLQRGRRSQIKFTLLLRKGAHHTFVCCAACSPPVCS